LGVNVGRPIVTVDKVGWGEVYDVIIPTCMFVLLLGQLQPVHGAGVRRWWWDVLTPAQDRKI